VTIRLLRTFFFPKIPLSHILFKKKSKTKNQKKKREKYVGVAKPPLGLGVAEPPLFGLGVVRPPQCIYIYILDFYFLKIKYMIGAF
jgi:hypothetical protein